MLFLYRFFSGFLKIKIMGDFPERLINKCVKNNIVLWNIRYLKNAIVFKVSIKDFKRIFRIRKGLKIKIEILKKYGFPFIIKRYKNRYGIIVGIFIFIVFIYFMSGFVWNIEINGNKTVGKTQILRECESLGIKIGAKKSKLNTKILAEKFLIDSDNFAWAAFNIEGCVLSVDITETKNNIDANIPSNIKAIREGIITKIDVTAGNCIVKVGDKVNKGDILVSGIIENSFSTEFVHSIGDIFATTEREYIIEEKYKQKIVKQINKPIKRSAISFFGIRCPIYLGKIEKNLIEKNYHKDYLLSEKIPILLFKKVFVETEKQNFVFAKEDLIKKAQKKLKDKIKADKIEEYEIIESNLEETKDGIILSTRIKTEENIASQDILLFDSAK